MRHVTHRGRTNNHRCRGLASTRRRPCLSRCTSSPSWFTADHFYTSLLTDIRLVLYKWCTCINVSLKEDENLYGSGPSIFIAGLFCTSRLTNTRLFLDVWWISTYVSFVYICIEVANQKFIPGLFWTFFSIDKRHFDILKSTIGVVHLDL